MPPSPPCRPAGLLLLTLVLGACGGAADGAAVGSGTETIRSDAGIVRIPASEYHGTLLDPPLPRPDLTLADTDGKPFSLRDRPDEEVTVLFFGYTHCPDVCPTAMADLAAARRHLPEETRDQVVVAFVTEDPQRDTPAVLREWLDMIDRDFVGLRGGNAQTQEALRELYLPESAPVPSPSTPVVHPEDGHEHPGDYGIEHASVVYAFGPAGTVVYTGGFSPQQYAQDFARLTGEG